MTARELSLLATGAASQPWLNSESMALRVFSGVLGWNHAKTAILILVAPGSTVPLSVASAKALEFRVIGL